MLKWPVPKEASLIFLTSYTCTLMNVLGIRPNPMIKRSKGLQRNPITRPEFNLQSAWPLSFNSFLPIFSALNYISGFILGGGLEPPKGNIK